MYIGTHINIKSYILVFHDILITEVSAFVLITYKINQ